MSMFFNYFPSLIYSNTAVTNIIAKVRFEESVAKNLAVFYPYTVSEGERADQIAENYYEDSSLDWLVYLSNGIIDPYHEWPKTEVVLTDFIKEKYGSIANAQIQTAFYRVNYDIDDTVISPAAYQALAAVQKQYWSPILGYNETVINYQRKEIDSVSETNKVISLTGTFGSFNQNDVIKQSSTVNGTVGFANSTTITLKHVSGTWQANSTVYYALGNTVANATVTSVTNVHQPLQAAELAYWIPVSCFDVEVEKNEQSKTIRLMSSAYVDKIERDMKDLLSV